MAATVRWNEYNGAGESATTGISNFNYGNVDSANITPGTSNVITAGNNSFTKFWKFEVTNLGGLNQIDNLQFYKSAGAYVTGEGIQTNLRASSYGGNIAYATPTVTTYTDQVFPVAAPGGSNLGIAGILAGALTLVGLSDRLKTQLQTTGSTPGGSVNQKTFTYTYDEQ